MQEVPVKLIVVVLGIILVLVLLPFAYQQLTRLIGIEDTTVTISGREIAKTVTEFVRHNQRADGSFYIALECTRTDGCGPLQRDDIGYQGYSVLSLIAYADAAGSFEARKSADQAMEHILAECTRDRVVCEQNFYALEAYFAETGDAIYRVALERSGPDVLARAAGTSEEALEAAANSNIPHKLAALYDITGDARYHDALVRIADATHALYQNGLGGRVIYTNAANGYEVRDPSLSLFPKTFIPAHEATGDAKYLSALHDFYMRAQLDENTQRIFDDLARGIPYVLPSVEALTTLSEVSGDPEAKMQFKRMAQNIIQKMIDHKYDSEIRPLYDGTGSFLATPSEISGDVVWPTDGSRAWKSTNINGGVALAILNGFSDVEFTLR